MTEAEKVAAGLSAPQREAVLNCMESTLKNKIWFRRVHGSTMRALHTAGISDYSNSPARLTSLGLAVRDIIMKDEKK